MKTITFFLLCLILTTATSYRILGIFPHFGKSHFDIFAPILRTLAENGHDVTVLSFFPQTPPIKNYKDVVIEINATAFTTTDVIGFDQLSNSNLMKKFSEVLVLGWMAEVSCTYGMRSPDVQRLLKSKAKYDLIVIEAFNTDCYLGFVHKFKAPFIQLTSSVLLPWFYERFGMPDNPSYIPNCFMGASDEMGFFERVENVVVMVYNNWMYYYFQGKQHTVAKEFFGEDLPSFNEIAKNASLIIGNTHFTLNRPKPLVPGFIEIGGLHVGENKKLPQRYFFPTQSIKMLPILLLLAITGADCYKILGVFPYPGKSHFNVFQPLLKGLIEKGHEVTVISQFPLDTPIKGYTDVSLKDTSNNTEDVVDVTAIPNSRLTKHFTPVVLALMASESCDNLRHPAIVKLLNAQETFDVILVEQFNTDCFLPVVHHFKAPFIGITSHILMPWTNARVANIDNPSYVPNHFLDFSDEMNFLERVENTVAYLFSELVGCFMVRMAGNRVAREALGEHVPDVAEIARNVSMILTYTHFTLNRPRPLVPAMVEIGGLHIGEQKKLPQNIEKWINESREGVIYFSMGSMIKGHTFPEDKRQAFLRAFGRLKQRVLWKWENDTMPGKPDNVMIQKWMPQFDILCHPNVKAFISHGGLLGTTEAVHCGVPVVVMPQFGDQHTNARALEAGGGGIVLNFRDVDEDSVHNALRTVLDPEFAKKAKELSERFRDRPMPPMQTAIYWIEYVARHKGAHHMRTAAVGMPFYQYLLLDVIAFLGAIVLLVLYVTYKILKAVIRKLFGKSKKIKKN